MVRGASPPAQPVFEPWRATGGGPAPGPRPSFLVRGCGHSTPGFPPKLCLFIWDPGLTGAGELSPHNFTAISEAQAGLQILQVSTPDPVTTTPRQHRHDASPFLLSSVRCRLHTVMSRARLPAALTSRQEATIKKNRK